MDKIDKFDKNFKSYAVIDDDKFLSECDCCEETADVLEVQGLDQQDYLVSLDVCGECINILVNGRD